MELKDAEELAKHIVEHIRPHCERVEVAGSIRRKKSEVRDIDLVLIVKDWLKFTTKLQKISSKFLIDGPQQKRIIYKGEQIDLYLADHKTYEPQILIRTGSAAHNIKLSTIARKKGMKLSHRGLTKEGKIIASTEKEIFEVLDLPYVEPEERE